MYVADLAAYLNINFEGYDSNPFYSSAIAHKLYINNKLATNITIPDEIAKICDDAFNGCIDLTSVTIPNTVISIGDNAFRSCYGLTNITIPDSVTSIGDSAFRSCNGLTNVTIPDNVTNIGNYVFYSCNGVTNIKLGNGLTSIGDSAFQGCIKLTSIKLGSSVESVGEYAFRGCNNLKNIEIPVSIKTILANAFAECTGLTDVYYAGTYSQWNSIVIASGNSYLTKATMHYQSTMPDISPDTPIGYPYVINNVLLKTADGNPLTSAPQDTGFIVDMSFKKIQARDKTDYIFVAVYDTNGVLLNLDYIQSNFVNDQVYNTGFYIPPQSQNIGSVKVYVWNSFNDITPLAESKEINF